MDLCDQRDYQSTFKMTDKCLNTDSGVLRNTEEGLQILKRQKPVNRDLGIVPKRLFNKELYEWVFNSRVFVSQDQSIQDSQGDNQDIHNRNTS